MSEDIKDAGFPEDEQTTVAGKDDDTSLSGAQLHKNHRKRMIDKYMSGGRDSMPDHELLEILLFSSLKRVNTNPLAHALIKRFGSLAAVFDADIEELLKVDGIGFSSAFLIKEIPYLWSRYELSLKNGIIFDSMEKIGEYFVSLYKGATREAVYLMMLDNSNKLIECRLLSQGSVDSAELSARKITEAALSRNSSRLVLAHNHPGGTTQPSDSDITFTRAMRRALAPIDLQLMEHIIVTKDEYLPLIKYIRESDKW